MHKTKRMKKIKLIFSAKDFREYVKSTACMVVRCAFRIPFGIVVGFFSVMYWLWRKTMRFCREHTKAAVIIGFALCFVVMLGEFIYFKVQLRRSSYVISELIKRNYKLEQTDRYDVGYHDAMRKTSEMLTKKQEP